MKDRILIDVKRIREGEPLDVTRMEGVSGVALMMEEEYDLSQGFEGVKFPITAVRFNNAAHATILLAGFIACVREIEPNAVTLALQLSACAGTPIFKRDLPK